MKLETQSNNLNDYLTGSEIIDYDNHQIQNLADRLSKNTNHEVELAKKIYQYVRDKIAHSWDIKSSVVTCSASQVLRHSHGLCFAKSHLLAALLRYLKIPTGFCYQRLVFDDNNPCYFTLHGLNAIYLASIDRWIRVDARGNKSGVKAEFNLDREILAYPIRRDWHEIDYLTIYIQPNQKIITSLKQEPNLKTLIFNLPDEL